MKILVLNCGSSSLKFQLIETSPEQMASHTDRLLASGIVERIGSPESLLTYECPGRATAKVHKACPDHQQAVQAAIGCLEGQGTGLESLGEIEGVGHRVVHGGERFRSSVVIDEEVLAAIESVSDLAPLHNPNNLKGYYAARAVLPAATHVAVFDTAFHQDLPPEAFLYALPYAHYSRERIRRYGFHGTSHRYLAHRFAQIHRSPRAAHKLITCHLGNGCSVCAIDRGRSVETSMGFTPLEGLVMGTRCGDLDPGVVVHLLNRGVGVEELENLMNHESGLYGVSGISNDMRDLLREQERGNQRAELAIKMFCHRVRKYLGAYYAVLEGAGAIIFAGGIGESSPAVRAMICESLGALGVRLDAEKNAQAVGVEKEISAADAPTKVWVIPTNEELLIARDTLCCILHLPEPN
jgi:acetate kinase